MLILYAHKDPLSLLRLVIRSLSKNISICLVTCSARWRERNKFKANFNFPFTDKVLHLTLKRGTLRRSSHKEESLKF